MISFPNFYFFFFILRAIISVLAIRSLETATRAHTKRGVCAWRKCILHEAEPPNVAAK